MGIFLTWTAGQCRPVCVMSKLRSSLTTYAFVEDDIVQHGALVCLILILLTLVIAACSHPQYLRRSVSS